MSVEQVKELIKEVGVRYSTYKNIPTLLGDIEPYVMDKNIDSDLKPVKINNKRYDYVQYGLGNVYPDLLRKLYNLSPTHKKLISIKVSAILGEGIAKNEVSDRTTDLNRLDEFENKFKEGFMTFSKNLITDWCLFGALCFLVKIRNNEYEYEYIPIDKVRVTKDSEGCIIFDNPNNSLKHIYITKYKNQKEDGDYLFYKHNRADRFYYYGEPDYISGLKDIHTEALYASYNQARLANGIFPERIIRLSSKIVNSPEQMTIVSENFKYSLSGAENGGKTTLLQGDKDEIEVLNLEATKFSFVEEVSIIQNNISNAHRNTSPILIGENATTTLTSNSGEMNEALKSFTHFVVYNERKMIEELFSYLYALSFGKKITIKLSTIYNSYEEEISKDLKSILTLDEKRKQLNLPALSSDDKLKNLIENGNMSVQDAILIFGTDKIKSLYESTT